MNLQCICTYRMLHHLTATQTWHVHAVEIDKDPATLHGYKLMLIPVRTTTALVKHLASNPDPPHTHGYTYETPATQAH